MKELRNIGQKMKTFGPLVDSFYREKDVKILAIKKIPKKPMYAVRVNRPSMKDDALIYHIIRPGGVDVEIHGETVTTDPVFVIKGHYVLPAGKDLRYLRIVAPQLYKKG